jgi:hypothetical protein
MDVETVVGRNDTAFSLDLYINNRYTISHRYVLALLMSLEPYVLSMESTTFHLPPSH